MVSSTFKRWMTNADFIRQVELSLSREDLAFEILGNETKGLEQLKKVLRAERPTKHEEGLLRSIARVYAEKLKGPLPAAEKENIYIERIRCGTYPTVLDNSMNIHRWVEVSQKSFNSRLNDYRCVWILPWQPGYSPDKVHLQFDESDKYDEHKLPPVLRHRLNSWKHGDAKRDADLRTEPYGHVVRLDRVQYNSQNYDYTLHLSQIKFWQYLAVHKSLSKEDQQTQALRRTLFDEAINNIPAQVQCTWPSHFCLHMGLISNDGYAILRKRQNDADMYPGAWEFGCGEFMHGPATTNKRFQTFENGKPDMFAFCRATLREEVDIDTVDPARFKIFGFAVEYESLAPKLLILHYSNLDHGAIMDGMRRAKDASRFPDAVPLKPQALASTIIQKQDDGWGPTSKLCLWLALMSSAKSQGEEKLLNGEFNKCLNSALPKDVARKNPAGDGA